MTGRDEKFTCQRVLDVQTLTPERFRLRLTRDSQFRYRAGQFVRLGVRLEDDSWVWRPYSMLSSPRDDYLEFLFVVVPGEDFTDCLSQLQPGDPMRVERQPYGFLTLDRFSDGSDLWLMATGTGIAPFMSILREEEAWRRFAHIRLVYCVRHAVEWACLDVIETLAQMARDEEQWRFLPVLTGERRENALFGRITELLRTGALEAAAGRPLAAEMSRIMLCGHPQMVEDMMTLLKFRGMHLSLNSHPGQLAVENHG